MKGSQRPGISKERMSKKKNRPTERRKKLSEREKKDSSAKTVSEGAALAALAVTFCLCGRPSRRHHDTTVALH